MSTLLMAGILFGIAGTGAVLGRRRIEEMMAFAALLIGIVLCGFALADALPLGYAAVKYAGLACLGFTVAAALCRREHCRRIATPGALALLLVMLVVWIGHRGQLFMGWDDFTHWGLAVKSTFQESRLPQMIADNTLLFPDYPPLTTLFSCFWISLSGAFNEGDAQRAMDVMLIVCFLPMLKHTRWCDWKQIIPLTLLCVMIPTVFRASVYSNLAVDGVLGGVMAYALILWFACPNGRGNAVAIGTAMLALPLIKASGLGLGIIALVVMTIDKLMHRSREARGEWRALAAVALCLAAGKLAWSLFLRAYGVESRWGYDGMSFSSVAQWLAGDGPLYRQRALENFFLLLCRPEIMGEGNVIRLSYVMWMVLLAWLVWWLRWHERRVEAAPRYASALALTGAGSGVYALSMLVIYAFSFEPNEAAALLSFDRYMSTYMTALLALAAMLLLELYGRKNGAKAALAALTAMLLVASPEPLMRLTASASQTIREGQETRAEMQPPQYTLDYLAGQERSLTAFVGQETTGLPYYACRYAFSPLHMGFVGSWSFYGTEESADEYRSEGDSMYLPPTKWRDGLINGGFTHVYLHSVNDSFAREYGFLFEEPQSIAPKTLYTVVVDGQGQWICLRKVV